MPRHTFATSITLSNGVPIETVSKMLGHDSLKTTQIYARIVDSKISDDMKKLKLKLVLQLLVLSSLNPTTARSITPDLV